MIKNISPYSESSIPNKISFDVLSGDSITIPSDVSYIKYEANGTIPDGVFQVANSTASFGTSTTGSISIPTGTQPGDVVFVFVGSDSGLTLATTSTGWTTSYFRGVGDEFTLSAWKRMGYPVDTSFNVTGISLSSAASAVTFRNVTLSTLQTTTAGASTGLPNPPSITAISSNSLILIAGFLDDDVVASVTAPANFTLINFVTASGAIGDGQAVMGAFYKFPFSHITAASIDPATFGATFANGVSATDEWVARTIAVESVEFQTSVQIAKPSSRFHKMIHHVVVSNPGYLGGIQFPSDTVYSALPESELTFNVGQERFIELYTNDYGNTWIIGKT